MSDRLSALRSRAAATLVLLFFCALTTPALAYRFCIVNPTTQEVMETVSIGEQTVGTTLSLPNRTRLERVGCTLSDKYYTDAECKNEVTTIQEGFTDYYIPYTFDAATLKSETGLVFSTEENPVWMNLDINNNHRTVTYNASNAQLPTSLYTTEAPRNADEAQWAFVGDPYKIKIINRANPAKAAFAASGDNGTQVLLQDYDVEHSLWVAQSGNKAGAFQLKPKGMGNAARQSYWNAAGGSGSISLYSSSNDYKGTDNDVYAVAVRYFTYHIVNKSGAVALSRMVNEGYDNTALTMPAELKSPYITSDASYKFFDTQAHAAAYTAGGATDGEITLLSEAVDNEVFVGYQWDGTVPAGLPALDGNSWYQMEQKSGYFWYTLSSDQQSRYHVTDDATAKGLDHLWHFTGNDPYAIYVANRGYNKAKADGGDYLLKGQSYQNAYRWIAAYLTKDDGTPFIILKGKADGYYRLTALGFNSDVGKDPYLRHLRGNTSTNPLSYLMKTTFAPSSSDDWADLHFNNVPIADFTFHLPTRMSGTMLEVTQTHNVKTATAIVLPDAFGRKYIASYTYYTDYNPLAENYDDRFSNEVTSLKAAHDAGKHDIYVKYTVGAMPFDVSQDYDHARWYRLFVMDGAYAHLSNNNLIAGADNTFTHDYLFAFIGDPYELKVINRAAGDGVYLGVPIGSDNQTAIRPLTSGITSWELYDDGFSASDVDGDAADDPVVCLRAFGTYSDARYAGYYNNRACYFSTVMKMQAVKLPQHRYTYHIVDRTGRIAIKSTPTLQDITTPINIANIPSSIISPYIEDETLTAYRSASVLRTVEGRSVYNLTGVITETPTAGDADIYIRYTLDHLSEKTLRINGKRSYNVVQPTSSKYMHATSATEVGFDVATSEVANTAEYLWNLVGNDPYAVQLQSISENKYYTLDTGSVPPASSLGDSGAQTYFIVMAGTDPEDESRVKMVASSGTTSLAGSELKFTSNLPVATYHIVDKSHKIVISGSSTGGDLEVPAEITSPLVAQYHYYKESDFNIVGDTYTLKDGATELNNIGEALSGSSIDIYVTYDVSNEAMFAKVKVDGTTYSHVQAADESKDAPTYMIRFLNGEKFNQENEVDGFLAEKSKGVYPYNNGDGGLFVYGEQQWANQLAKAASTRGRWLWYIESETMDPYHVKVASRQDNQSHFSYLRTYKPQDYTDIVTNVITGNVSKVADGSEDSKATRHVATEYMILGTPGHGRFVTVEPVSGSGKVDDHTVATRETITSFEQYWKNALTVQDLLPKGQKVTTAGRNVTTTSEQRNVLEKGQDGDGPQKWHHYNFWANSNPWVNNGDAEKTTGRKFGYEEHWFQTIDMGNGEFTLEEVVLNATLVLLDKHGWEIARFNLPNGPDDPRRSELYGELKKVSSPMVARYHYWKTGAKVPGYHQFTVSDHAVDANGNEYTSQKLGFLDAVDDEGNHIGLLPDYDLQGKVGNQSRDWYVTYDVKDEYADAYKGAATEAATEASAYMVKQGSSWLTASDNTTLGTTTTPADYNAVDENMLFYLRPNFNIDREMGYLYKGESGAQDDALSKAETETNFFNDGKNGFDPYNVQIQSKLYEDRYVTTNATEAHKTTTGEWSGNSSSVSLKERRSQFTVVGDDQAVLNITNATFMVVDDGNGGMRLVPRFDQDKALKDLRDVSPADKQTFQLAKPTVYTYHVINKKGRESVTWRDPYFSIGAYNPDSHFPDFLRAYGVKAGSFRYLPLSEFDSEALLRQVYRLVNAKAVSRESFNVVGASGDIYVVYDVDATKRLGGLYNMKLQNTNYLNYVPETNSVSAAATSLTAEAKKEPDNIWRIDDNGVDPYDVRLYNFRQPDIPLGVNGYGDSPQTLAENSRQSFIVVDHTPGNAGDSQFRFLAANSNDGSNGYAYLTLDAATPRVSRTTNDKYVTLEPVALSFTYKLYDLSGNLALQATVSDVSDLTPSLPDAMRSPLVKEYYYYKDVNHSEELTTLAKSEGNTVHVGYMPYKPEEVALKLDGSALYTMHTKSLPGTLFCPTSPIAAPTYVSRRDNYYELQLLGRTVNGQYDPYDVAVYSPSQNRYWDGNVWNNKNPQTGGIRWNQTNAYKRFAILDGSAAEGIDYVQMVQRKVNGSAYYPDHTDAFTYLYVNASKELCDGQGTGYSHLGNDNQLHYFQRAYVYHVLNMNGSEAVGAIEPRIVKPDITAPVLPEVVQSPAVKRYHFYDVSSFEIGSDGVYTLKIGAKELSHVSDATTQDIYVVYTAADLDRSYGLDGSKAYNIIFAPDEFTQDDVTQTLNSYFGYDTGLKYYDKNTQDETISETNKFQVTGSYYADPSAGYQASQFVVVHSAGEKGTDDGSNATRWNKKYIVEPELTEEQKESDKYLWVFTGNDPYNLQVHNQSDPSKYIYRNGDSGGYTVGLTLGTTTNTQRGTFMLMGRGTGDATRYNLMAPGNMTGGNAPYSFQYIGRSYNSNVHRNARRGVVLQGFHEWGWSYQYYEQLVSVKLVPQKLCKVTYVVMNKNNKEAIRYKVEQTRGMAPNLPAAVRSPYAKDFRYWTDEACTSSAGEITADATIYVTYNADTNALNNADIDLTGNTTDSENSYNIIVNGNYFYNSDGNLAAHASPTRYDDNFHEWYLKGNASGAPDPYDVRLQSRATESKFLAMHDYDKDSPWTTISTLIADDDNEVPSFILMNGWPNRMELLAATGAKTDASASSSEIKNRLMYLGYNAEPQLLGVGTDDANPAFQSGMRQVQVQLKRPLSGITYHIMNLNGEEAVRYTVNGSRGEELSVPEPVRSPFATGWQYWNDATARAEGNKLTTVPDSHADIYVTYVYNDDTNGLLQLDGQRFYNMRIADWYVQENDGAVNAFSETSLTTQEANVTANLWALDGTTGGSGIDPYNLRLVNKLSGEIYAGAPMTYVVDTETSVHMSDGEEDNFRSAFFVVASPAGEGLYEMALASGAGITDNVLAYVNRHSGAAINLNRENSYQHGSSALRMQFSSPVNQYLYKVYNRSGELAIQAWGEGVAGGEPEIPNVIKSPLVNKFYYDVETLPYTTGADEIRVTYDVDDDDVKLTPNLSGGKFYNIKFRNNYFLNGTPGVSQDNSHTNLPHDASPVAGDVYVWTPNANMGDGRIDPYDITLMHGTDLLYSETLSPGSNDLSVGAPGESDHRKFILLSGTDDKYQLMAATGDRLTGSASVDNSFAYLGITNDNQAKLLIGQAHTQERTSIQIELVPFVYKYTYIVVNNSMYEAVRVEATQEAGDPVWLPDGIRSPLISAEEYEYYTAGAFSTIGGWRAGTDPVYAFNGAEKAANTLTGSTLPYTATTIYVRYKYTPKAGGVDLTGTVKYQIAHNNGDAMNYMIARSGSDGASVNRSTTGKTTPDYMWKLESENADPYDVRIRSMQVIGGVDANGYLYDFCPWRYGAHSYEIWTDSRVAASTDADISAGHIGNHFAILGHEDGGYRLMTMYPGTWDEKKASANEHRYYPTMGYDTWYTRNNTYDYSQGLSIQIIPATTHNYRFHLTTKIDGRELVVEKKLMVRDLFELPEELQRKYCTYTYYYYTDTDVENTRVPITKEEAEADGRSPIPVGPDAFGVTYYPYFPAIDGDDNQWVDIYVDYNVIPHYKVTIDGEGNPTPVTDEDGNYVVNEDGMPFNVMGYDHDTVHRLLSNESGFTEYAFQISTYEELNEKIPGLFVLPRKDYLYFMVLKTNDDFTNGNGQYFLRREDSGRISYLNNDFRLHYKPEDNYKKWSYTRCAEAYRENDHDPFQEKHWLWCYAGDPYDLYMFNAGSVVEEQFDVATGKTVVTTHRDHLVGCRTQVNTAGTTTEHVVNTPGYEETPSGNYRWGLAKGQGAKSDKTFSLITGELKPTETPDQYKNPTVVDGDELDRSLYWCMSRSNIDNRNEVMLLPREADNTTMDYNIQVLPYEPTQFLDLRFVVHRDDDVAKYTTAKSALPEGNKAAHMGWIDEHLKTGTIRMYSTADDRLYAIGDVVTKDDLPIDLIRKFCEYKVYKDIYTTEGDYEVTDVVHRGEVQRDGDGNIIYNIYGRPMYNYYTVDPNGVHIPCPPQTIYIEYKVTTDKFLKKHPTKAQVADMLADNDHVYFMDFADPNMMKGNKLAYNTGHHAYFEDDATFKDQIGSVHGEVLAEKMKWDGSKFVYDTDEPYNKCRFKTTNNRMESIPERLKWYFVGDPYQLQVYCTQDDFNSDIVRVDGEDRSIGTVPSNLCRFDPTETSFQFVVDCVHFRSPDESIIDERKTVSYRDVNGNMVEVDNVNYKRPYYPNFYWEVVPTTTDDEDAFALRFRADNQLLGYRDVFYYLAHDGIRRTYKEAMSDNPKSYSINLSYDETNTRYLSGKYLGYHRSNDVNCAIRLVQPTKIYFTAYKETYAGDPVVKEELTEYFGLGETLTEVPRHLQRKFVSYGNLEYQKNKSADWNASSGFPFTLTKDKAYNLENCAVHNSSDWVFKTTDTEGEPTKARASFKFRVTYELDDETSNGEHLFTPRADLLNPDVKPQWLDVTVGGKNWLYYDKTHLEGGIECDTTLITKYPPQTVSQDLSGWDTGIKGLHWAFVGDPYSFTVINRRRWEDLGQRRTPADNYNFWLGTAYAREKGGDEWYNYIKLGDTNENRNYGRDGSGGNDGNGNTTWGLMMCKTGGASDYFMRTASPKTTSVDDVLVGDYTNSNEGNMTNRYARLVRQDFVREGESSVSGYYTLEDFALKTKTKDIQKMEIRTAVAEDDDGADNDCFDANVRIYDKDGNLKATLKHVEVTYGNVFASLPYTLRRYGCNYIDCYQIAIANYAGSEDDDAAKSAYNDALQKRLQNLGNFTGTGDAESFVTQKQKDSKFSDASLDLTKLVRDLNGRRYIEIAYVYTVDEAVAPFFTSLNDARQDEYTWTNAYYEWEQEYKGTNLRVVELVDVFDHYVYNADGHIVDEVYRKEERVTYPPGTSYSTTQNGWLNSHDSSATPAYGDERTQSENNNQKWALVGDPYDFELTNYAQYLDNSSSALTATGTAEGSQVTASNVEKSHWAIVAGDVKTTLVDGKKTVVTDDNGDPVILYYLALIDDDETSPTYGMALKYVTFDRTADNKDLKASDQYLYLNGGPLLTSDPTGDLYNADDVKGFNLADLMSYANMVVYHLVMPHRYSLTYTDTWPDATEEERDKRDMDRMVIDRHLAEWMKYKHSDYMADAATVTIDGTDYTWKSDKFLAGKVSSGTGAVTKGSPFKDRMESGAKTVITGWLKGATLRDIVTDSIEDYIVSNVAIGNKLKVPWYMRRQNCKYTLYQRDVMKSLTLDGTNEFPKGSGNRPLEYAYLKNDKGEYIDRDGNVVDKDHAIQLFLDDAQTKPAYEIRWVSVVDYWTDSDGADKIARAKVAAAKNGKEITKLDTETHKDRMVVIDVVYDVDESQFRFVKDGEDGEGGEMTTAWYTMMTDNESDGQMHYSYRDGVDMGRDRSVHATNDWLWAPEGDPYGFVLRNRYASVNGTGWGKVALTTDNGSYTKETANAVTHTDAFTSTQVKQTAQTEHNAVYEMMSGMHDYSFLMHPTAERISTADETFAGSYVTADATSHKAALAYVSDAKNTANTDKSVNWILMATPEQLLPYFDRAGYVGGLKPEVAANFTNRGYYGTLNGWLKSYRSNPAVMDFATIDKVRKLVYAGELTKTDALHKFTATNLVPVGNGFYRIQAYSRQALDHDDADIKGSGKTGVQGPRYISGYRHQSEANYSGYASDANGASLTSGHVALHFYETDEAHAKVDTFSVLTALKSADTKRALPNHPAMRGNIKVLPVEYDPSSIFRFETTGDTYGRFNVSTQGLSVQGAAGDVYMSSGAATPWRLQDIGGAVVTAQILDNDGTTESDVQTNIQTNYLSIDADHRYSVTVQTDNELEETGDSYAAWSKDGADYAVQTTKWMLQPVGVQTEWPYNQLPLSVKVNAGGQKPDPATGGGLEGEENKDNNYYASLYVPFDTRLAKTIDGAYTGTAEGDAAKKTIRLTSVSQLNNMSNPQFIPAEWPVILRTSAPVTVSSSTTDAGSPVSSDPHVNLYLPNFEPTVITENRDKLLLYGSYLEHELSEAEITELKTDYNGKTGKSTWTKPDVMVFGLPFNMTGDNSKIGVKAGDGKACQYYGYKSEDAVGFYTNENWKRDNADEANSTEVNNKGDLATSFHATARNATYYQRSNKYVYHNKVFYLHDYTGSVPLAPEIGGSARQAFAALFEETDIRELEEEADDPQPQAKDVRWGVFDLAGRQLRTREAVLNGTWRRHLPPGMYIVNGRKLLIK